MPMNPVDDGSLLMRIARKAEQSGVELTPVGPAELERAERELGFPLPQFLRRLLAEVGDGGFGPGLDVAIPGYPAGLLYPLSRVVDVYRLNRQAPAEESLMPWPEGVLEIMSLGGFSTIAVDCRDPRGQVLALEDDVAEVRPSEAWTIEAESLEQWFADWLTGRLRTSRSHWLDWQTRI